MVPSDWKVGTVEDIAQVTSGGTPSRKKDSYWAGGIPWVTTSEVKFGVITKAEQAITEEGLKNSSAKLFPKGTLLIAMYGQGKTRGQVAKLGIEASTNQACAALLLKSNNEVDYYFQYLISQYENLRESANNGGQKNLSAGIIKSMPVPIPPLPEQRKIAKILSTWDKAIATTEKLIAASKQQKKALMQQSLTGKKRLVNPETGRVFEGEWEEVQLGEISYITTGSSNREDSSLDGEFTFFDRSEDIRTSSRFLFDAEAVIVPGEGQNFIPKYFKGKFDLHQRTYAIMNFDQAVAKFIYFYIGYYSHYFLSQAVGSTVKSLRLPMFKKMPVKLPHPSEQQKIAQVLTAADQEIEHLESKLAHFQQEKKALMQQLLTGKRRVKVDSELEEV